jgi:hypothetical protein
MKIFIICPVRSGTPKAVEEYVAKLEKEGHQVHFPPRDTNQSDRIGISILGQNVSAIRNADEVHMWYDAASEGSHFDFGVTFALNKPLKIINPEAIQPTLTKSFANAIRVYAKMEEMSHASS